MSKEQPALLTGGAQPVVSLGLACGFSPSPSAGFQARFPILPGLFGPASVRLVHAFDSGGLVIYCWPAYSLGFVQSAILPPSPSFRGERTPWPGHAMLSEELSTDMVSLSSTAVANKQDRITQVRPPVLRSHQSPRDLLSNRFPVRRKERGLRRLRKGQ